MTVDETFWGKNQETTWLQELKCVSIEDIFNKALHPFTKIFFHINSPGCQKVCGVLAWSQDT